jgi:hypothetical protein
MSPPDRVTVTAELLENRDVIGEGAKFADPVGQLQTE